jgi:hypothetical protein
MGNNDSDKYEPPETTTGDKAHTLAKAGLASIPVVGGAAAELFSALVTPPLEKRRREWMEQIAESLQELEQAGAVDLEDLQSNDAFITTLMQASRAAVRNHQEEKIEALRNAVLNSALDKSPDESEEQMFLSMVDRFTVWHLRILKVFQDPKSWAEKNGIDYGNVTMGSISTILEAALPKLKGRKELYTQIWKELNEAGLFNTDSISATMGRSGMVAPRTTDMGDRFLEFIESPEAI